MRAKDVLVPAVMLGLAGGYAWSAIPSGTTRPRGVAAAPSEQTAEQIEHSVYYARCADAWAAGEAPISEGQPGYRAELDGDSDGIACEPYRGS